MKKQTVAVVTVVSFFVGAAVSACDHKVCQPGTVRTDETKVGRYWVCNNEGTKEAPYEPPTPPHDK